MTPKRSIEDPIDRLTHAFERLADRVDGLGSPRSDADRFTHHLRRFAPYYALALVWVLVLLLMPTRPDTATDRISGRDGTTLGERTQDAQALDAIVSGRGSNARLTAARDLSGIPQPTLDLDPLAWKATGITRGGFKCGPGVRQIPWSAYAVPCFPRFTGDNGGATYRGVTRDEILLVNRRFPPGPDDAVVDAFTDAAGFGGEPSAPETLSIHEWMKQTFELWGRKIKIVRYESQYGDEIEEGQGRGKEGACADAEYIVNEIKPFGIVDATAPLGECAAERGMFVFSTGSYYPESWYRKYHPYLWNGVPDCERVVIQAAEYVGKRLANRPAKWAKSLHRNQKRNIGVYVPNNDEYQHCLNLMERELRTKYNGTIGHRYNYALDVSRFPDEATRAIVQFRAENITSIILACDPLSPVFLTEAARGQEYYPEWVLIGVALTDVDQFARLWDQEEVAGSLFGMSQLGSNEKILGKDSEAAVSYRKINPGREIPPGDQADYYENMLFFNILQAAGPVLTPENIGKNMRRIPPGGAPRFEIGYVSYRDGPRVAGEGDHTATDDSREVYWVCEDTTANADDESRCSEPKGHDGAGGLYRETYGGRRFRSGQWPSEEPPIYP